MADMDECLGRERACKNRIDYLDIRVGGGDTRDERPVKAREQVLMGRRAIGERSGSGSVGCEYAKEQAAIRACKPGRIDSPILWGGQTGSRHKNGVVEYH